MTDTNKLLRVTQMNAIYLDNEIYRVLMGIIQDASKYLPPGYITPLEHEISLILRMAILYNSVVKNKTTFGQQLLSIEYENMTPLKKGLYLMSYGLGYLKDRLEFVKPSHGFNNVFYKLNMIFVLMNFVNVSIFLRNGVKPLLIERLLGLEQVYKPGTSPRVFQSKYLARELLWNGFIEILLHVLPLVNYHKIRRTVRHYNPFRVRGTYVPFQKKQVMTIHSVCAHCGHSPNLPHHMGCAHIFCYICLKGNQTADSRYECPICEHRNPNIICDKVCMEY